MRSADPRLDPAVRRRLAQLLGLLGSDHAGERDNAGRMAHALVRSHGLTWLDVIGAPALPEPEPMRREQHHDPLHGWPGGWRGAVETCLRYGEAELTSWEWQFCINLLGYSADPSPKQKNVLRRLLDKVCAGGSVP